MIKNNKTRFIARIAVLSAIASILYAIPGIPVIPIAPFYKLDFSTLPALLAGFSMGPIAGVVVTLIKDVFGLLHSESSFIGELADFAATGSFVFAASMVYSLKKSQVMAAIGMGVGVAIMCVVAGIMNYYVLLPLYMGSLESESMLKFIAKTEEVWSFINSPARFVIAITVPFNMLKALIMSAVTMLIYKPLSPLIKVMK